MVRLEGVRLRCVARWTMAASFPAAPPPTAILPHPTNDEVLQCQFSNWYNRFSNLDARRRNVTIKSIVIRPLPADFIEFLQSDGVRLPLGATQVSSCVPSEGGGGLQETDDVWSSDDETSNDNDDHQEDSTTLKQYSFPELNRQVQEAIEELGGSVLPKLNWSAPKDATWINNGTLKCQTPGDVYLLLKSSDFVMHDVEHAILQGDKESVEYELVLRKWCNLHPSMEFRCFVYNHELVAISQRQHTQHFPHLSRDRVVTRSQIIDFFDTTIEDNFPLPNYVFDVYIDKKERVWLLDFNVWGTQTDSLLFGWEELVNMNGDNASYPEMRVVETEREVHHDPLASYRAPIDTVELAAVAGNDRNKFEEFMALCERPTEVGNNDEEE